MHYFLYTTKDTFITNRQDLILKNFGLDDNLEIFTAFQLQISASNSNTLPIYGEINDYLPNFVGNLNGNLSGQTSYISGSINYNAPDIINPIFYDTDSDGYYNIIVKGQLGNEYLQIISTTFNVETEFALYNSDSGQYYTLEIEGITNFETISIIPSESSVQNNVKLYNPDNDLYYFINVVGANGQETISLAVVQ